MRRGSIKLLAKLTIGAIGFLIGLYCLIVVANQPNSYNSNDPNADNNRYSSLIESRNNGRYRYDNNVGPSTALPSIVADDDDKITDYNVWCIFTKVTSNSPMRRKFRVFVESLLRYSSFDDTKDGGIVFHVITDDDSKPIAEKVIEYNYLVTKKSMKVNYYNVHKSATTIEEIVSSMSPHFSSKPGTYYSDALFFISLGLHKIASSRQNLAIMIDADTKFRVDVRRLFDEFQRFGDKALFGLGPELTPVYRHVLYAYRSKNPKTTYGEPYYLGGYPGYNSGVILLNLKRLRESLEYDQIVGRDSVEHMVEKYEFKGHLGDQDFYTLLGMERPEFIHTIDCGWNRQLCTWWRERGYADVFANYSRCNSETKLWHGNCNTPIPDD